MSYDFDHTPERRWSDSIKWNKYGAEVLPLWVADMDFHSPDSVMDALKERVEHGVFGYPKGGHGDHEELDRLCEVIRERLYEHYGWDVEPDALQFLPGVVTGLNMACHAMAGEGGAVLVQPPVYTPILGSPKNAGMQLQEAELVLNADGTYSIDYEAFEAAISAETHLFLLCSPHNPVGKVFTAEELRRMAEICARHQVVICSDEIHCDLVFPPSQHTPIACLDEEIAQNTITLMSPSKTYNIAGLRFSFAITPNAELRRRFHKAQKGLVGGINTLGIVAALAAYREGDEWLRQVLGYLEANRNYLYNYCSENLAGVTMAKPEGTYLAWLNCRGAGIEGKPNDFFLDQAQVALVEGESFGRGGEGYVRLNFGCSRGLLEEALGRMRRALEKLPV
jgi:cysteine-S-conjugate beta-lyase